MVPNEEKNLSNNPENTAEVPGSVPPLDMDDLNVDALLASFREQSEVDASTLQLDILPTDPVPVAEEAPAQQPEPEAEEPAQAPEAPAEEAAPSEAPAEEADPQPAPENAEEATPVAQVNAEEYLIDTMASMGLEGSTPRKKRRKRHPHFFYYIAEAFRGIFGHGFMSFAAVSIITACLIIMGTFSLIAINVNNEISQLMDKNEFLAYVNEDYTTEEAQALEALILAVDNVSEVTFITRQQAYENYISDMEDTSLYADLDPDTVFRDRYSVRVTDLTEVEATSNLVLKIEGIDDISIDVDLANSFVALRNILLIIAGVLVGILLIISLFIISNTIKLVTVSRQEEIAIMRMVGATSRFIRWPFIYQGAILGLLGSGLAYGIQIGLYFGLNNAIQAAGQSTFTLSLISLDAINPYLLAVFLSAGLLIGIIGSWMAIRKFLRV